MKKFTIVQRDGETLTEKVYFANKKEEVKALDGFVAITDEARVKHPSPEVLQRVLILYSVNQTVVDLANFYRDCELVAAELDKQED